MRFITSGLLSLLIAACLSFSSITTAAPDSLADTIDFSQYSSTELDVHKALIYTALHYQWDITEHQRKSMVWQYRHIILKMEIDGQTIRVYRDEDYEINQKWLPRIKKLVLRRLEYFAQIRKAESLVQ